MSNNEYEQQQFWNYDHKVNKVIYDIVSKRIEEQLHLIKVKLHNADKK